MTRTTQTVARFSSPFLLPGQRPDAMTISDTEGETLYLGAIEG